MTREQITFLTFGILLILALAFDLGLLSKKSSLVTIKKAIWQTAFWVTLAMLFFGFLWIETDHVVALKYLSAYLMEWSLSVDNIFVFILLFAFFRVKEKYYARVLLIGILMAILCRIAFISIGIGLVARFEWILYIFGAILVYTGITMFRADHGEETDLENNRVYKLLKRFLPLTAEDGGGKWTIRKNGKKYYTSLFVVVIMLATTDIVFALDSIPAVFAISQKPMVVYTSNIFAVLGLRSLFFLLKGAANKFAHLQQGIAIVLIFIGAKMLAEIFHVDIPVYISLLVIITCITASIIYSVTLSNRNSKKSASDTGTDRDMH
ncbi:MAG TPA: TerC/Alx family metal homeostasis membrane protein [Niastella sp.]